MKPLFTHIGKTPQESLIIVKRDVPYFDTPFHFHPECELVYITSGTGKRIIGDKIEVFGRVIWFSWALIFRMYGTVILLFIKRTPVCIQRLLFFISARKFLVKIFTTWKKASY